MDQAKGRSQKLLLLVLYVHTSNCIAYSPTGLRVHNRIGIARLVGFCDAASRLSMASGTAGRYRLVLACLSLVEEDPYTVSGGTTSRDFSSRTATRSMYKNIYIDTQLYLHPLSILRFPCFPSSVSHLLPIKPSPFG